ncbi:hypothetical protein Atai01_56540 [Amycolatopsis taiwanensis]|uniref:Uncharacterized protein n=1 Tax=Amycolatopsis taiwanensis TaxID=342230 RepID=A0A9W6VHT5_9PSEU|nr:hypothetical protein Atai01_56540 [Amycolatopsis taiwanensis]
MCFQPDVLGEVRWYGLCDDIGRYERRREEDRQVRRQLSPEQAAAAEMVAMARQKGLNLTGPNGVLKLFTPITPTEQAALKCLYLVTRGLDPTGTGRTR